jgi:Flp pilus assembly protein TadG
VKRGERGSNLIEMTFVIIFMLSLIMGAIDLGLAYQHYGVAMNAAREGARIYARLPCTDRNRTAVYEAIVSAAVNEPATDGGVIGGGSIQVNILQRDVRITPNPKTLCPDPGKPVEVRVSVLYRSQFGELFGLGDIPITASATMVYDNDSCGC